MCGAVAARSVLWLGSPFRPLIFKAACWHDGPRRGDAEPEWRVIQMTSTIEGLNLTLAAEGMKVAFAE